MKKILAIMMALIMAFSFAACSEQPAEPEDPTTPEQPTPEEPEEPAVEYTAQEIYDAIKGAYAEGEFFDGGEGSVMEIDDVALQEWMGVDPALVVEYKGATPMINTNIDRVLVVKAVEGKGEEVETALNATLDAVKADTMQYPMNLPKIQAAQVVRNGDYVAFLMCGAPDMNSTTDEEYTAFAEAETQKAIDAFNALFE